MEKSCETASNSKFIQNDILELYTREINVNSPLRVLPQLKGALKKLFTTKSCLYVIIALRIVRSVVRIVKGSKEQQKLQQQSNFSQHQEAVRLTRRENEMKIVYDLNAPFPPPLSASSILGIIKQGRKFQKDDETMKNNVFHL